MQARLTPNECAALGSLAASLDCSRVRVYRSTVEGARKLARTIVLGLSGGRAVTLGNHIFLPEERAQDLALLAHEVTHCGQFQRWGVWKYFRRGAAAQTREWLHRTLRIGVSPYHYRPAPDRPFQTYGMEQQAQIVEDCFRGHPGAQAISPYRPGPAELD
jgi:hypothetical protein